MFTANDLEEMAKALDASEDFRVLRRLVPASAKPASATSHHRIALIVDTETTGLDTNCCELIEIGMVAVAYDETGLKDVVQELGALQEPSLPLNEDVRRVTGLRDEELAGHRIDSLAVERLARDAAIVVAHNASFDRPVLERHFPAFRDRPWACSLREIDWLARGTSGARLEDLVRRNGLFHRGHRALDDCRALHAVLAYGTDEQPSPFFELITRARLPSFEIYATGAPFEVRGLLKERAYRWNAAERVWVKSVSSSAAVGEELEFLNSISEGAVYPKVVERTAHDRYRR